MKTDLIALSAIAVEDSAEDFGAAITGAIGLLVQNNYVLAEYLDQVLESYANLGPYFVVAPQIAIAHAKPSTAVLAPGLSLLKLVNAVDSGNTLYPSVSVVLGLATPTPDAHIELMAQLATKLSDEEVMNSLLNASAKSVIHGILNS